MQAQIDGLATIRNQVSQMKKLRNDFTDQMLILLAVIVPSIIGSWIGGGGGFVIGLVIAVPITIGIIRYVEGEFPLVKHATR